MRSNLLRYLLATIALLSMEPNLSAQALLPRGAADGGSDNLTLGIDIDSSYAYRLQSNEILLESGPYRDGIDFTRSYLEAPPFIHLGLYLGTPMGFSVVAEGELRREWREDWFKPSNFMESVNTSNPLAFDNSLMSRGVLYWRGQDAAFAIGRDKVHYGPALSGTLYPSERLPYLDGLRAEVRMGPLTMDSLAATIQAKKARKATPDVIPGEGFGFETDDETGSTPTIILSALHRFSWDFPAVKVGFAGMQIVSRRNNYFLLSDIFPVFTWHSADVLQNNLLLLADLSWTPLSGLVINTVVGIDEISAESFGVGDSGIPTIPAIVFGVEYSPPPGGGVSLLKVEAGYTHYLWGNYDGHATNGLDPNPLSRSIFRYLRDGGSVLLPLTSPYGPGALWITGNLGYLAKLEGLTLTLECTVLSKNTQANLVNTAYIQSNEIEDAPRVLFASLRPAAEYSTGMFTFTLAPAILVQDSAWWLELDLGASVHFSLRHSLAGGTR